MLSDKDAWLLLQREFPDLKISYVAPYNGIYLFKAIDESDPDEGDYDPFYSVDQQTGDIAEFSMITDGDPAEIYRLSVQKN